MDKNVFDCRTMDTHPVESLILRTERLSLKVLDESFADRILAYYIRNKEFLKPWEPEKDEDFYIVDYHREALSKELAKIRAGESFRVWIFKKEDRSFVRPIGSIALNNIIRGCFHNAFLGYRLDGDELNQGYMTEAIKGIVDYGFRELKLHRIEANIMPHNAASLKVAAKLNFSNEGLARKYLQINGKWEDHIHMVVFNEELE